MIFQDKMPKKQVSKNNTKKKQTAQEDIVDYLAGTYIN